MNNKSKVSLDKIYKNKLVPHLFYDFALDLKDTLKIAVKDIWFLFAFFIGLFERIYYISEPIKYDESFTFINYVNQANPFRIFWYNSVNNHLLNTLMIKFSTFFLGNNLIAIRIPAFVIGMACIFAIYHLCITLGQSGKLAAISVAICPYLISYSTNARAYSLVVLFTILLITFARKVIEDPLLIRVFSLSLIAALGLFSIPSMLFPILSITIWTTITLSIYQKNKLLILKKFIAPFSFFTILITTLLYTPSIIVTRGLAGYSNDVTHRIFSYQVLKSTLIPELIDIFKSLAGGIPRSFLLLFSILIVIGILNYIKESKVYSLILPSFIVATLFLIAIKQVIPFDRTLIYFIPVLILLADNGFTKLLESSNFYLYRIFLYSIIIIGLLTCRYTINSDQISTLGEPSYREAPVLIKYLKDRDKSNKKMTNIITSVIDAGPLMYYQWYYDANISVNGIKLSSKNQNIISWANDLWIDILKYLNLRPRFQFVEDIKSTNKLYITNISRNKIDAFTDKKTKIILTYGNNEIHELLEKKNK